jgi:hypothetical protein
VQQPEHKPLAQAILFVRNIRRKRAEVSDVCFQSKEQEECKYSQNIMMVTRNPKQPSFSKRSVGSDYFEYYCALQTHVPCLALGTGYIENWRLGSGWDDVQTSPYSTPHNNAPNFSSLLPCTTSSSAG